VPTKKAEKTQPSPATLRRAANPVGCAMRGTITPGVVGKSVAMVDPTIVATPSSVTETAFPASASLPPMRVE